MSHLSSRKRGIIFDADQINSKVFQIREHSRRWKTNQPPEELFLPQGHKRDENSGIREEKLAGYGWLKGLASTGAITAKPQLTGSSRTSPRTLASAPVQQNP